MRNSMIKESSKLVKELDKRAARIYWRGKVYRVVIK